MGGGGLAKAPVGALKGPPIVFPPPLTYVGRRLERPESRADPDGLEVVDDGLAEVSEATVASVVPGVEAVWIAGLGQELLRTVGIVRDRRRGPGELVAGGNDARRR